MCGENYRIALSAEEEGLIQANTLIRFFRTFHGNSPVDVATCVQFSSRNNSMKFPWPPVRFETAPLAREADDI